MAKDLRLVGVNCEPDLYDALDAFARKEQVNLSLAGRLLLRAALEGEGARLVTRDLRSVGYREGYREGIADVHAHMAELKPRR